MSDMRLGHTIATAVSCHAPFDMYLTAPASLRRTAHKCSTLSPSVSPAPAWLRAPMLCRHEKTCALAWKAPMAMVGVSSLNSGSSSTFLRTSSEHQGWAQLAPRIGWEHDSKHTFIRSMCHVSHVLTLWYACTSSSNLWAANLSMYTATSVQ